MSKITIPQTTSFFEGFENFKSNFTPVPNEFFAKVAFQYPSCVVEVVMVLIRETLGWEDIYTGGRKVEAEIPRSRFMRYGLSEQSTRRGINGAIEAGLIRETMPATNAEPARYALRWKSDDVQNKAIEKQRRGEGESERRGIELPNKPRWKTLKGDPKLSDYSPAVNGGASTGVP